MSKRIIAVIFFFYGCKVVHRSNLPDNMSQIKPATPQFYKIVEIDSMGNYYLIYAQKSDSLYKIISKKVPINDSFCERIKINLSYSLSLNSMSLVNGKSITPSVSKYEVSKIAVDDTTFIPLDIRSHWDLYYTNNLSGLCKKE